MTTDDTSNTSGSDSSSQSTDTSSGSSTAQATDSGSTNGSSTASTNGGTSTDTDQTGANIPYNILGDIVTGSTDADASQTTASATDSSSAGTAVAADSGDTTAAAGGTVTELVNLGLAVFKVMDDGTPNMVPVDQMGSGVPSGVNSLTQMSNFSSDDRVLSLHYHFDTRGSDLLPSWYNPTDLNITIRWRYGGQYQNIGHYVAMANVAVSGTVGTSRHIDVTANFDQPINVGPSTDPIADLGLNIVVSDNGPLHTNQFVTTYRGSMKGNGAGELASSS